MFKARNLAEMAMHNSLSRVKVKSHARYEIKKNDWAESRPKEAHL
jgi:hypothetical protein